MWGSPLKLIWRHVENPPQACYCIFKSAPWVFWVFWHSQYLFPHFRFSCNWHISNYHPCFLEINKRKFLENEVSFLSKFLLFPNILLPCGVRFPRSGFRTHSQQLNFVTLVLFMSDLPLRILKRASKRNFIFLQSHWFF